MTTNLAIRVRIFFGLAFDIEKTIERKSGFRPAEYDLSSHKKLFGDLRLDGFSSMLESGFAERLIVIGGIERRYPNESVGRAWVIRKMLIEDLGISSERIDAVSSAPNTGGNIETIGLILRERCLEPQECAIVSNHYHLPRIQFDLRANKLLIATYPAEAFQLLNCKSPEERTARKSELIERLGSGHLAERLAEEINGIADKLIGSYRDGGSSNR